MLLAHHTEICLHFAGMRSKLNMIVEPPFLNTTTLETTVRTSLLCKQTL